MAITVADWRPYSYNELHSICDPGQYEGQRADLFSDQVR